ncbi:phage holin family protein [Microvirga sp. W0021]|uniref:Phage holin family protein n=1 Tax=Hohaiivirga grylli TaxID=3133970 RepID=A0ABV0BJJ6_9HYPH
MRRRKTGAFQDILFSIVGDVIHLAQKEFALFKAETEQTIRGICFSVVLAVLGICALIIAIVFLGIASFEWLVVLVASRAIAALIVAGGAIFIALISLGISYYKLSRASLVPKQTIASIKQDVRTLFGDQSNG